MQIGFLTYDLQPFTEDCLYRISQAIKPKKVKAYPIIMHRNQYHARIPYLASLQSGKHFGINRPDSTPEGLMANINWRAAYRCAVESDIVVLFGLQGGTALITTFLSSLMRRKILSVNQTLPVAHEMRRRWWIRWIKAWLLNRCLLHIYQTPVTKEVLIQVYKSEVNSLFYAPFEAGASIFRQYLECGQGERDKVRHELGVNKDTTLFLFVGNLMPFKGIPDLIGSLALLHNNGNFYCILAGPEEPSHKVGGTIGYFTQVAEYHKVERSIRFLGELVPKRLAEIYLAADVVILPTHKDCFPKVLVEGALAEKPLITTDACGSVGAVVIDGENGFVVKPGDIEALSEAMKKLLNKELREKMGKRSLEIVNTFCNENMETLGYVNAIKAALGGQKN